MFSPPNSLPPPKMPGKELYVPPKNIDVSQVNTDEIYFPEAGELSALQETIEIFSENIEIDLSTLDEFRTLLGLPSDQIPGETTYSLMNIGVPIALSQATNSHAPTHLLLPNQALLRISDTRSPIVAVSISLGVGTYDGADALVEEQSGGESIVYVINETGELSILGGSPVPGVLDRLSHLISPSTEQQGEQQVRPKKVKRPTGPITNVQSANVAGGEVAIVYGKSTRRPETRSVRTGGSTKVSPPPLVQSQTPSSPPAPDADATIGQAQSPPPPVATSSVPKPSKEQTTPARKSPERLYPNANYVDVPSSGFDAQWEKMKVGEIYMQIYSADWCGPCISRKEDSKFPSKRARFMGEGRVLYLNDTDDVVKRSDYANSIENKKMFLLGYPGVSFLQKVSSTRAIALGRYSNEISKIETKIAELQEQGALGPIASGTGNTVSHHIQENHNHDHNENTTGNIDAQEALEKHHRELMNTSGSYLEFVDRTTSTRKEKYKPHDLHRIRTDSYTKNDCPQKDPEGNDGKLRLEAKRLLTSMAKARKDFSGKTMRIASAFRSYQRQYNQTPNGEGNDTTAPAGCSEHQLGLAVDIGHNISWATRHKNSNNMELYRRMELNAHKYGYVNSYQKEGMGDGYKKERRHWRFVGVKLATDFYEKSISLGRSYTFTDYRKDLRKKFG